VALVMGRAAGLEGVSADDRPRRARAEALMARALDEVIEIRGARSASVMPLSGLT
jgi:hypothetical protein